MLKKKKNNKGFTLVELLVVIAIIGILAVVAVPSLMKSLEKSKVAKLEADYNLISTAMITYYADKNEYPTDKAVIAAPSVAPAESLKGYIDEVANPFKANYAVGAVEATDGTKGVELHISNIKISDDAIGKLKNDLGSAKVTESAVTGGVRTLNIAIVGTPTPGGVE